MQPPPLGTDWPGTIRAPHSRAPRPLRQRSLALLLALGCAAQAATPAWTRWEQSLTSAKPYADPAAEIVLRVIYRGPGQQTISGLGFWAGGDQFKLRCFFPRAGRWTWETACSDAANAGLHAQRGVVDVAAYTGDNPLYRGGYLRVSDNHRYLVRADGSPFLWIGDTAWAAPMNASWTDWQTYVQDRVAKRFTVLQMFCASDWAGAKDWQGQTPLLGESLSRINPAYWNDYDRKVQYANEQGLVVAIVGLMEPIKRYPETEPARCFTRQLVARLMGNFVLWSPSFDSPFMELGDAVGQTVKDSTSEHLTFQHPGTDLPAARTYQTKGYADLAGLQSGAGWGGQPLSAATVAQNAVEWALELYRRTPTKPVINLECRYDSEFNQRQLPRLPRSSGYWTLLSGAAGYTYGCAGIWNWGLKITHDDPQASLWDWRVGLSRPSSTDIKHLANLFARFDWWRLEPHPEGILNQTDEWARHMVLATAVPRDLAVAYLPDNDAVRLDRAALPASAVATWFDPRNGAELAGSPVPDGTGPCELARPAGWEDALLVFRSRAAPAPTAR